MVVDKITWATAKAELLDQYPDSLPGTLQAFSIRDKTPCVR